MFFGDPFPPKNRDENKAASLGSTSESETELKLEETAVPCGSISAASHTADEVSCQPGFHPAAEIREGFVGTRGCNWEPGCSKGCRLLSRSLRG